MEQLSKPRSKQNLPPIQNRLNNNDDPSFAPLERKYLNNDLDSTKLEIIDEETKNYIDEMKRGSYNILVAVRCRPGSIRETELSNSETVKVLDGKIVVLMDPIEYNGPNTVFKGRSREQTYAFDFAFDKTAPQKHIFEKSTKFLGEGVVNGFNATVFAYGATGAGKTYTMLGNDENPGIMPQTGNELFIKVNEYSKERDYAIKLWYLEIYNENIRDLLSNKTNTSEDYLELREDPSKGVVVSGITEGNVTSCKDILKILKRGNKNRTQEATGANETSSRSHAILQVGVEYKDKACGIEIEIKYGKLSLIDLAGSERASSTQNRGIRGIEGANINRSLLTLGNCINALCDAAMKGTKPYVPYRDSKLTRLLKDSGGGNARTVMITNIAPSINTFVDTYNTLKYANRAKNIKTYVQRNVGNAQHHISNYVNIINNLKNEISDGKSMLRNNGISPITRDNGNANASNASNTSNPNPNIIPNTTGNCSNNINNTPILGSSDSNVNIQFKAANQEIIALCNKEFNGKQKCIFQKIEISKLLDQINLRSQAEQEVSNVNDISHYSNKDINSNDMSSINNTVLNQTEIFDTKKTTEDLKAIGNTNKQSGSANEERLKEYSNLLSRTGNNYANNGVKDFQYEYLNNLIKINKYKLNILDTKYFQNINKSQSEIKDEYIAQGENQLKGRDNFFMENNINIYNGQYDKLKSVTEGQSEYKGKVPIFKQTNTHSNNKTLPPISNYRMYNQDNSYCNNNHYNYSAYHHQKNGSSTNGSKKRSQNSRSPTQANMSNRLAMARNYSQSLRYLNQNSTPNYDAITPQKQASLKHSNSNSNIQRENSSLGKNRNVSAIKGNNNNNIANYGSSRGNQGNNFNTKKPGTGNYKNNITIKQGNSGDHSGLEADNSNDIQKIGNNRKQFLDIDNTVRHNNMGKKQNISSLGPNDQVQKVKQSDLNYGINERDRKRSKFGERVNNINQD